MSESLKHYDILGVRVDAVTTREAIDLIISRATDTTQPPGYVAKIYVELIDMAQHDAEIARLLNNAWLNVPEGVSTQWAATYLFGKPQGLLRSLTRLLTSPKSFTSQLPEKFSGPTFTWKLLEAAAQKNVSVYLVGSPQGSDINASIHFIEERLPKLKIVGGWPGKLDGKSGAELRQALATEPVESELVADLKRTKPGIVFIAMGFPLQEELCAKLAKQLDHGVLIGEGGTFDYDSFGGVRRRAPVALRKVGLEWLWRLALEPKRIKRQLSIPRFILAVHRHRKKS